MSDYVINFLVILFALLNLVFNLYHSQIRSPFWWCDPRGLMAVPLFLSTSGFSLFYMVYGEYPKLFGVHEENLVLTMTMLVIASWAFTAGTFLTLRLRTIGMLIPALSLGPTRLNRFLGILIFFVLLASGVSYYGLYSLDFFNLISLQYGAGQWDTVNSSPWLRASVLCTPLLSALILAWGFSRKSFFHPGLLLICVIALLPAVFLGGRKDAIFVMIALAFALATRAGANRIKPILYAIATIAVFNYVQAISRDAGALDLATRLSSIGTSEKNENSFIGQVSTALPIVPTVTAGMTIFPDRENFNYGLSYVQTLAGTVVPKVFFGDATFLSPNENFHELYYPEVMDFSMDYSLAAEGYQNFGVFGIALAYFLMGCFLANIRKIAAAFPRSLWQPLNLVIFQAGMWSLRSDSNTFLKVSFYTFVVLVFIFLLARLRWSAPPAAVAAP